MCAKYERSIQMKVKKILSVLLAVMLLFGIFGTVAFAHSGNKATHSHSVINSGNQEKSDRIIIDSADPSKGLIHQAENDSVLNSGDIWNFTAVPQLGYDFSHWTFPQKNNSNRLSSANTYGTNGEKIRVTYSSSNQHWYATAHFIEKPVTEINITFNFGTQSTQSSVTETYTVGDPITAPVPDADKITEGWEFNNTWSPDLPSSAKADMNGKTYKAQYSAIQYDITYNLDGGTNHVNNPSKYTVQSGFSLNHPTKTGYTFTGWSSGDFDGQKMTVSVSAGSTGPKEYTAHWTPITYSIKYNKNSSSAIGTMENSSHTYGDLPQKLSENQFTRSDHKFIGWATDNKTTSTVVYADQAEINSDLENTQGAVYNLYAKWAQTRSVTYYPNGATSGTVPSDLNGYINGETVTVLDNTGNLQRSSYVFAGWNTNQNGSGTTYTPGDTFSMGNSNVRLYAKWVSATKTYDHIDVRFAGQLTIDSQINGVSEDGYPKTINVTVSNVSGSFVAGGNTTNLPLGRFTYDAANKEWRATNISRFVWPSSVTINATLTDSDGKTYPFNYTFTGSEIARANANCHDQSGFDFDLSGESISKTITHDVTFKTSEGGKINGGTDDVKWTGVLDGTDFDTILPTLEPDSGYAFAGWSPSLPASGKVKGDGIYTATFEQVVVTGITLTGYEDVYDGDAHSIGVSGQQAGDTVTFSTNGVAYSADNPEFTNVGEYTVYVKVERDDALPFVGSATVKITPAALTVTADDFTITYLDPAPAYTAEIAGFVDGEDEDVLEGTLAFACDYEQGNAAGEYDITPSGLTADNYNISFVDGKLTVNKLFLTVKFEDWNGDEINTQSIEYGSSAAAPVDPTRGAGWYFIGWSSEGGLPVDAATINSTEVFESITYIAQYEYRFVVRPNASMVNGKIKVTYGDQVVILDANEPHTFTAVDGVNDVWFQGEPNNGYRFLRWNSAAYSGYVDDNGKRSKNIYSSTLFTPHVIFEAITYDIKYNLNGGKNHPDNPLTYTVEDAITLEDATRTGYTFNGWTPSSSIPLGSTGLKTFTAQWNANNYTVTYYGGEGTTGETDQSTHTYGSFQRLTANGFAKKGYTFAGWATSEGGSLRYINTQPVRNLTSQPGGIVNLYAVWLPKAYIVNYNRNGGSGTLMIPTAHVYDVERNLRPNTYTKVGYTFVGWAETADGELKYGDGVPVSNLTADYEFVTLYAVWVINEYDVTFVDHDGTELKVQTVEHGSGATAPEAPNNKVGYHFIGWDKEFDEVIDHMTVTALYAINEYDVTFVDHDGTELKVQTVEHGSGATAPAAPNNKIGYHFTGWDKAFDEVTGNMTVTALYAINVYTVTFVDHNGTVLKTQQVEHGSAATAPEGPGRTGYTFTGWNVAFNPVTGDLTVTAQYVINTYAATFVSNGGTDVPAQTVTYNALVSEPADPTRVGYAFSGWFVDSALTTEWNFALNAMPANDITLYAAWTPNAYTVRFENFDGSLIARRVVLFNGAATAPADPQREGYTFIGWDSEFNRITRNITVTAMFRINTFTVRFVDHDGTLIDEQIVDWNTGATAPTDPQRDGFTFTGWDAAFGAVTADLTVTAQYDAVAVIAPEPIPESPDTIIDDEPVPEAGPVNDWLWWLLLIPGIGLLIWLLFAWLLSVVPIAESVSSNGDGTYTVQWGYENRKLGKYTADEDKSVLSALVGKIMSTAKPPVEFEKGRQENVFTSVVNDGAKVQWKIGSRKAKVDLTKEK